MSDAKEQDKKEILEEGIEEKSDKKEKKGAFESTHKSTHFWMEKDIDVIMRMLLKNNPKDKSRIINTALRRYFIEILDSGFTTL
ncbi:hypothetical protein [Paenibacillus sp. AR247]|uniref:hypothetical protein n=1 Tax=Paenibacillus sp. AR247 TaxID=1631599 RepID=UPI000CF8A3F4|nr:hypothetical protein [Paenibacillus sp. AR247]PQP85458.1 hypothetical protein CPT76_36230 [Paenibacillus sp. AR247]